MTSQFMSDQDNLAPFSHQKIQTSKALILTIVKAYFKGRQNYRISVD